MPQRLSEQYPINASVEIYFPQLDRWIEGIVIGYDHPGIWIKTPDDRPWFVTNGRRVRPYTGKEQTNQ